MDEVPELVYDRHSKTIYIEHNDDRTELYSDATQDEFSIISDIDDLVTEASTLSDKLIATVNQRKKLVQEEQYFATLNTLQQDAGEYYDECLQSQSVAKESDSDIVTAHLGLLYKLEKFLKHYFRELSVAQSTGFSEQLLFSYMYTDNYVFLYGFVRNACSTLEYLGKLLESRRGKGVLGLGEQRTTFKEVYQELQQQGLQETFADNQEVVIPGTDERMQMGEIGLDGPEMDFLWNKRNDIVHHCPVVVEDETAANLPDDLLTTAVLTQSNIERLTQLASRVHIHSIGMFLKFSASYIKELVDQLIEAWHPENSVESG